MTVKQPRSDAKIRKRQKLICNWPEELTKHFLSWNVLELMLKDRLFLSCQKEGSFGREELKKRTKLAEKKWISSAKSSEMNNRKGDSNSKLYYFHQDHREKKNQTHTKCNISWRVESESKLFIL